MKTISEYLEEDYKKWPDRPYITARKPESWITHTFRETIDDIHGLSHILLKQGFQDKNLMLCSENSYEWIVFYLAIMGYVGTCVPVDKEWTVHDFRNILSAVPIAAVFCSRTQRKRLRELEECYPEISWFCMEDMLYSAIHSEKQHAEILCKMTDPKQTAMILFTSGTTDLPKAIPLTQENLFANWNALYRRTPMTEQDISYVFLPFHHVYTGVANILYTIISGMQLWLCSDLKRMIPELMEVRPTIVCTVPLLLYRMYEAMSDDLLKVLQKIRFLYCGGSFTDPAVKRYFLEHDVCLLEAYGTTETSSVIALAVPGDPDYVSNGVVLENLQVRILDPDDDGVGEILVKGNSVSGGYLNPNSRNSEFDEDGVYHTGDLGVLDHTGHLYLKGRKKRMILTANGKNVYADEIETLILAEPQIRAAKVFEEDHFPAVSVVSDLPEEAVHAYIAQINRKLPRYKQIRRVYTRPDTLGGRIK